MKPETKDAKVEVKSEPSATDRIRQCGEEIRSALEKHGCRLVPYLLQPEFIGRNNGKMLVAASFGIEADP